MPLWLKPCGLSIMGQSIRQSTFMLRSLFVGFGVDVGITPGRCSAQGRACASERRHQVVAFCCVCIRFVLPDVHL